MLSTTQRWSIPLALVAAVCSISAPALGQNKKATPEDGKLEKISGVIVKVEPAAAKDSGRMAWKLTVNTDVVWRDFVRDQASEPEKVARTGTAKAAKKGKESVATEGHPKDQELLFTAEIDNRSEITMRYRSSTDSIGDGSPTADGAARAEAITSSSSGEKTPAAPPADAQRNAPKARVLGASDLKPGLWVDVEVRKTDKRNLAQRVTVLRPVGGPDTPPSSKDRSSAPSH